MSLMYTVYDFLWADLITIPLPNGGSLGLSLLVLMLVPAGIYFHADRKETGRTGNGTFSGKRGVYCDC